MAGISRRGHRRGPDVLERGDARDGRGTPASARAVPGRASAAAASLGRRPAVSSAPPRRALALARARSGHGAGPPGEEDDRGTRLSANAPPSAFARARARGTARATPRALAHPEWADGADARGDDDANARGAGPGRPPDDRLLDAETAAAARDRSPPSGNAIAARPDARPADPGEADGFPARAASPSPSPRASSSSSSPSSPPAASASSSDASSGTDASSSGTDASSSGADASSSSSSDPSSDDDSGELVVTLERRGEGWAEEVFPHVVVKRRPAAPPSGLSSARRSLAPDSAQSYLVSTLGISRDEASMIVSAAAAWRVTRGGRALVDRKLMRTVQQNAAYAVEALLQLGAKTEDVPALLRDTPHILAVVPRDEWNRNLLEYIVRTKVPGGGRFGALKLKARRAAQKSMNQAELSIERRAEMERRKKRRMRKNGVDVAALSVDDKRRIKSGSDPLKLWVEDVRDKRQCGQLTQTQLYVLDVAGFDADVKEAKGGESNRTWEMWFDELVEYHAVTGACDFPEERKDAGLGLWLTKQKVRNREGTLPAKAKARLLAMGVSFAGFESPARERSGTDADADADADAETSAKTKTGAAAEKRERKKKDAENKDAVLLASALEATAMRRAAAAAGYRDPSTTRRPASASGPSSGPSSGSSGSGASAADFDSSDASGASAAWATDGRLDRGAVDMVFALREFQRDAGSPYVEPPLGSQLAVWLAKTRARAAASLPEAEEAEEAEAAVGAAGAAGAAGASERRRKKSPRKGEKEKEKETERGAAKTQNAKTGSERSRVGGFMSDSERSALLEAGVELENFSPAWLGELERFASLKRHRVTLHDPAAQAAFVKQQRDAAVAGTLTEAKLRRLRRAGMSGLAGALALDDVEFRSVDEMLPEDETLPTPDDAREGRRDPRRGGDGRGTTFSPSAASASAPVLRENLRAAEAAREAAEEAARMGGRACEDPERRRVPARVPARARPAADPSPSATRPPPRARVEGGAEAKSAHEKSRGGGTPRRKERRRGGESAARGRRRRERGEDLEEEDAVASASAIRA